MILLLKIGNSAGKHHKLTINHLKNQETTVLASILRGLFFVDFDRPSWQTRRGSNVGRKADPHRRAADVVRRTVRGFGEEVTEGESPTQKNIRQHIGCRIFGEPAGARTQDPNIKSVVLYLLSYGFSRAKGI